VSPQPPRTGGAGATSPPCWPPRSLAALCSWAVASGDVGPVEQAVFAWVNQWPDWLEEPLWVLQLSGVLGMPLLVAIPALALHRWRLVVALVLLVPLKLVLELLATTTG
jgi:hypothetical protein